tara:strand:+ start:766 stop:870 length:105 start_codon:yes stop_codon:yes gene_type:complete
MSAPALDKTIDDSKAKLSQAKDMETAKAVIEEYT